MDTKRILNYTVVFESAPEGGYVAVVPMLPGCASQGESLKEAKQNITDAIIGYIDVLREDGEEIPVEGHVSTDMVSVPLFA